MENIYLIGIAIAFFLTVLLVSKRKKSTADIILTVWMLLMFVHILIIYFYATLPFERIPYLLAVTFPLPMLHCALLYLYAVFLTGQLPERRSVLLLHLVPAIAMYLYLTPFFLMPAEQKLFIFTHNGAGYEGFNTVLDVGTTLSGVIYVMLTYLLIRRHQVRLQERYSNIDAIGLQWLKVLTLGMGGIWVLILVFWDDSFIFSGVVVFIFLIGYFGIRQGRVFHDPHPAGTATGKEATPVTEDAVEETTEERKKYARSGLTEEESGKQFARLCALMEEERLYTRNDLSIDDLAERLGLPPNALSQIINENARKNFYDFVNAYRVAEFQRLLGIRQYRNRTLLSVALDCGFNSKSSFNRAFKRATGQTPSAFFASLEPLSTLPEGDRPTR